MTIILAKSSLSIPQLPVSGDVASTQKKTNPIPQNLSSPSLPDRCWQWIESIDSSNHRRFAPAVAAGVGALAKIAGTSSLSSPGPWQAITSLFYTINILLIPSSTKHLVQHVSHLKGKQDWPMVSKLRNVRKLIQSSLLLAVSTAFTAAGFAEACKLLGRSVKPLESGLNTLFPWIKGASRVAILFQVYDILNGVKLQREVNQLSASIGVKSANSFDLCTKIIGVLEKHRSYFDNWDHKVHLTKWISNIKTEMKECEDTHKKNEDLARLNGKVIEFVNSLLLASGHIVNCQIINLSINMLYVATMVMTNSVSIAILTLAASLAYISQETWNKS